jgi:hypothetical protein
MRKELPETFIEKFLDSDSAHPRLARLQLLLLLICHKSRTHDLDLTGHHLLPAQSRVSITEKGS